MLDYFYRIVSFIEGIPARLTNAKPRPEDYVWSRYDPIFQPLVRLTDGTWSGNGAMWRRRRQSDGRWEYQQDPETLEEQMDRII
ncbi:hypothetical protein EVC08_062 [Rhizobium phage RHph_N65]|nr:hypothetical protein EVC08_062 [Rhizobium phage RHph_N65]